MRKKACIVKRGNGWAVKQPLPDGRYRWQTVGPRRRDAELLRDEINRRVALGAVYPSRPQTFNEFVEGWLERYSQRVRPATLASCRDSLKRLAVFDSWQLETIRAADGRRGDSGALGPRRVRRAQPARRRVARSASADHFRPFSALARDRAGCIWVAT